MSTVFEDLLAWLRAPPRAPVAIDAILVALAERLERGGVPLVRIGSWLSTLHPDVWGSQVIWTPGRGVSRIPRPHDIWDTPAFQGTPGQAVLENDTVSIRCRLDVPREELRFPVLGEVADLGATDYLILALPPGGAASWIAFATDRPGGFTPAEIDGLTRLADPLSFLFRLASTEYVTRSLLEVYLGPNAASRVMAGAFKRGTAVPIEAAIWFCDMRGFTALSDRVPPKELVAILDRYFECVAGPIEDHGGEILKLIGDAALAVFPVGNEGSSEPCKRALAAAEGVLDSLKAWRAEPGRPDLRLGVALHLGEVMYGNIGGRRRLVWVPEILASRFRKLWRGELTLPPWGRQARDAWSASRDRRAG